MKLLPTLAIPLEEAGVVLSMDRGSATATETYDDKGIRIKYVNYTL